MTTADHSRLVGCVVLSGGLKPSPLQRMCSCSVLSLPISTKATVLESTLARIAEAVVGVSEFPVRVVYGHPVPAPIAPRDAHGLRLSIESESRRWRGPAGTLLDMYDGLSPTDSVLVLEGARWYGTSLATFVESHVMSHAEITIAQSVDRTPLGAYMMRRSALDRVPKNGFLDLKEQLIDKLISERRGVKVSTLEPPGAPALWNLSSYLQAADRACDGINDGCIIDPSANVDLNAMVLGSVIMNGAIVQGDAVVARSVVLPGSIVRAGEEIVDSVVNPGGAIRSDEVLRLMPVKRKTA